MKIKITEIEANAEELKNCNTLSQNLNMMLSRAFAPKYDYQYDYQDEESEEEK